MFPSEGLCPETKQLLSSTTKKKGKGGSKGGGKGGPANEEEPKTDSQPVSINLHFKRYVFDPHKKMVQSWHCVTVLQTGSFRGPVEVRGTLASLSGSVITFFYRPLFLGLETVCWDAMIVGMLNACETIIVLSPFYGDGL